MPSEQDIRDAQASAFADDVPLLLPEMLSWTLDDVEKYFESDGEFRPGAAAPAVTAAATVAAPTGPRTFMVVHEPRIAIRKEPRGDGAIAGSLNTGTKVTGTLVEDGEWLKLAEEKGYALIAHPKLGELLRLVESAGVTAPSPAPAPTAAPTPVEEPKKGDPLKKSFETKVGRKACGANIKTVDAAGASRDTLFDHLVVQELLHDFQEKFRVEGIPDKMYDTDHADDTECVTWCAMGGQIGPVPLKKGKRKAPAGGVRQRVEHLGGLRCIVAEKDEGSEEVPKCVVILAHGIHVLADDLYGLAYHIARSRVRFILPGGPEISSEYNKLDDDRPLRPPRQWFKWTEKDDAKSIASKVESAAAALRACAKDALAAAPGAQLVLGGFSQGAAVALHAALPSASLPTPAALVQLAAQAPFGPLPPNGLAGIKLLVAAGSSDPIAPIATANVLMDACVSAGAEARPLHTFDGEHEVTLETVHKVGELLSSLMDEAVAIN